MAANESERAKQEQGETRERHDAGLITEARNGQQEEPR